VSGADVFWYAVFLLLPFVYAVAMVIGE